MAALADQLANERADHAAHDVERARLLAELADVRDHLDRELRAGEGLFRRLLRALGAIF